MTATPAPVRMRCERHGWWARLARRLGQAWCGLRTGHRFIRQKHDGRYRLICWYCDYESTGWNLRIDE